MRQQSQTRLPLHPAPLPGLAQPAAARPGHSGPAPSERSTERWGWGNDRGNDSRTATPEKVEARVISALHQRFGNQRVLSSLRGSDQPSPSEVSETRLSEPSLSETGLSEPRSNGSSEPALDDPFSHLFAETFSEMIGETARLGMAGIAADDALSTGSNQAMIARMRRAGGGGAGPFEVPGDAGSPLPAGIRGRLEQVYGQDLGHVRIHTGAASAEAARNIGAAAFATGRDIHFGAGTFAPGTPAGDHVLAHEVAHVLQADAGRVPGGMTQPGDPIEQEAEAAAEQALSVWYGSAAAGTSAGSTPSQALGPETLGGEAQAAELGIARMEDEGTCEQEESPDQCDPEEEQSGSDDEAGESQTGIAGLEGLSMGDLGTEPDGEALGLDPTADAAAFRVLDTVIVAYGKEGNAAMSIAAFPAVDVLSLEGKDLIALENYLSLYTAGGVVLSKPMASLEAAWDAGSRGAPLDVAINPGRTTTTMVDDTLFGSLVAEMLTSSLIRYLNDHMPTFQGIQDTESYVAMFTQDRKDPASYAGKLPHVHNPHRFVAPALEAFLANLSTSDDRPGRLYIQSGDDHNGAFHRQAGVTGIAEDPTHRTLLVEGQSLAEVETILPELQACLPAGPDGEPGTFDEVVLVGHGNPGGLALGDSGDSLVSAENDAVIEAILNVMPADGSATLILEACSGQVEPLPSPMPKTWEELAPILEKSPSMAETLVNAAAERGLDLDVQASNGVSRSTTEVGPDGLELKDSADPATSAEAPWEYVQNGLAPNPVIMALIEVVAAGTPPPTEVWALVAQRLGESAKAWDHAATLGALQGALLMRDSPKGWDTLAEHATWLSVMDDASMEALSASTIPSDVKEGWFRQMERLPSWRQSLFALRLALAHAHQGLNIDKAGCAALAGGHMYSSLRTGLSAAMITLAGPPDQYVGLPGGSQLLIAMVMSGKATANLGALKLLFEQQLDTIWADVPSGWLPTHVTQTLVQSRLG